MSKLHLVHRALQGFRSGVSDTIRADTSRTSDSVVCQWAVNILCKTLKAIDTIFAQDAGAVIQILDAYEDESLWRR